MFESVSLLNGTLSSRVSRGSATTEWLQANFAGRDLRDTVYVTSNPQLERNREGWDVALHEIVNVWLEDGWDEATGTVRAETMTDAALDAAERFPNKRLIVHYMQPHYPFVPAETEFDKNHLQNIDGDGSAPSSENVWNQKFMGRLDVSRDELWAMYVENLSYALNYVDRLLESISGKTVITSDHGNFVGERASPIPIREYGHPRGLYDSTLTTVPWLIYETGDRRKTTKDRKPDTDAVIDNSTVDERLKDLGYK